MASTMLSKVKKALRITSTSFDDELCDLISAAQLDMGIAGVVIPEEIDAIVERAITTYCILHFGRSLTDGEYDRLKRSYDEQKAQLVTATGYTDWGDIGA